MKITKKILFLIYIIIIIIKILEAPINILIGSFAAFVICGINENIINEFPQLEYIIQILCVILISCIPTIIFIITVSCTYSKKEKNKVFHRNRILFMILDLIITLIVIISTS